MIRPGKWLVIPAALAVILFSNLEAMTSHNSELFIASVTILALVCWFTLLSSCVMAVGKIMA